MPTVTFVHPDGRRESHSAPVGDSVMDCALDHHVAGIRGQCGGACNCSTCHCFVEPPWRDRVQPPAADELELLSLVDTRRASSRLGCQIELTDALDGLVVHVPRAGRPS